MATIITDDKHYKAIADTIRAISGYGFIYKPSEMLQGIDHVAVASHARGKSMGLEEGYAKGVEEGKQAEYDAFWDAFQEYGNQRSYIYAFAGSNWTDDIYNPKYPIVVNNVTGANYVFLYSKITDTKVPITITGGAVMTSAFAQMSNCHTIRKITVDETVTVATGTFVWNSALVNIEFGGTIALGSPSFQHSTKLSKASITSIINALSTASSGLSLTLSKIAVNNAFSTVSGAADGSASSEWASLIATKPNWTISLI